MLAIETQIKKSFEEEGMMPEEIAEQLGLQVVAVKAKLMQLSTTYRRAAMGEDEGKDELNFSDDQLRDVNQIIYNTAMCAETPDGQIDYRTRLAAATYIRDDKKGRKEVVKGLQANTFNIMNFNDALQAAKHNAAKIKQAVLGKEVIEA